MSIITKLILFFLVLIFIIVFVVLQDDKTRYGVKTYLFTSPDNYNHYRLTDMVTTEYCNEFFMGKRYHLKYYQDSIVSKYFSKTDQINRFDILKELVDNYKLEKEIDYENTALIHLRLGEVIEESEYSAKDFFEKQIDWSVFNTSRYVNSKKYYEYILDNNKNIPKKVIIYSGGCFSSNKSKKSTEYINLIKNFLQEKDFEVIDTYYNSNNPDDDFVTMARSKHFIRSGGGFSKLIKKMVEINDGNVYTDNYEY